MGEDEVVAHAVEFLNIMSELSPPENICFRTFAPPRAELDVLYALADRVASGADATSPVSLTLRPGDAPSFQIHGTHAVMTLRESSAPATRVAIIVVLLVALVMLFCVMRQ